MQYTKGLFITVFIGLTLPLSAQFRSAKRSADKAFELHAYNLAIEGYREALAERPGDSETLARLGDAYRMLNMPDTARNFYERALQDGEVSAEVLLSYALSLKSLGEYELALPLFLNYAREVDERVGNHYARSCDFAITQRNQDAGFTVTSLPINSPGAEFGPNLPLSGQFVFNSARLDEEFDGVITNRPYVSQIGAGNDLTAPVPVTFSYRAAAGSNGPVSYSPDGAQVVFSRNNFTVGTRMVPEAGITLTLLIADVNPAGEWTNVRPLPFNGNGFNTGFGTFGDDANTIYFASDRPGGFGGYDIYRSRRTQTGWEATPENMGAQINSQGHEITPFSDGQSVFFSSNWHQGLGDYDVFRAEMQDGRATLLYHLGGRINSSRDDFGFVYDPTDGSGYVVSNRGGTRTQEDIYRVTSNSRPVAGAEGAATEPASGPERTRPEGVMANAPVPFGTVRGYVTDIQTNQPVVNASVTVSNRTTGREIEARTDVEGAYYVSVQPSTIYDVTVNSQAYESMTFPVTTPTTRNEEAFGNILLLPIQGGVTAPPPPPPTVTAVEDAPEESIATGFSVQLASIAAKPDLSQYGKVAALGPVYSRQSDSGYKVRLGPFTTREEASAAGRKAANMGYAGNFIVEETEIVPAAPVAEATPAAVADREVMPYRVQLGAFGKPQNFNRELAATLGTLGSEMRGALTIFYISAQDEAAASVIRSNALARGFQGAYLLKLVDGKYVKPNE